MMGVNEKQLERAYHFLALDGSWASMREQMGDSAFERMINAEAERLALNQPDSKVNSIQTYGITAKDMSCFKNNQQGNYEALEKILTGMHNSEIPHKILRELNSSEILGLYLGIGQLKTYGKIRKGKDDIRYHAFMTMDFPEQMSILISYAYRYNGIRIMKERGFTDHPTGKGELKKRMSQMHPSVQQQVIDSLKKPTVKSIKYDKINGYNDPNVDGPKDYTGRRLYVNHIVKLLDKIYEKNKFR